MLPNIRLFIYIIIKLIHQFIIVILYVSIVRTKAGEIEKIPLWLLLTVGCAVVCINKTTVFLWLKTKIPWCDKWQKSSMFRHDRTWMLWVQSEVWIELWGSGVRGHRWDSSTRKCFFLCGCFLKEHFPLSEFWQWSQWWANEANIYNCNFMWCILFNDTIMC